MPVPARPTIAQLAAYLLEQPGLTRCAATPGASLDKNPVENALRPLKLGMRNWLFLGHPSAGSRLANLFALIATCRHAGVHPEAYLIDLVTVFARGARCEVGEWLPHAWQRRRTAGVTA